MAYKSRKYKEPTNPVGTVAELFAGVGGFRIGLAEAGWKTVYSNQWEPSTKAQHASSVYVANFGEDGHSNEDISKVHRIPKKFDLLVGGFPCQDYSVAKTLNAAKGLRGKKGVLWWEILRLVKIHKPKFIFLENVDRLLKSPSNQRGRDFAIMLKTLGDEGYDIEWRVVNSADYGFPQRRIRVFIIAYKSKAKPDHEKTILKNGILAKALPVEFKDYKFHTFEIDQEAPELSRKFNRGGGPSPFANSGLYSKGKVTTVRTLAKETAEKTLLGDVIIKDSKVTDEYWIEGKRLKEWEFLKGAKSIERVHKASGVKYNYAEGKMAFPDSLKKPSRTILTGEGGAAPSRFKHVIKTAKGFRRLTPIELERLNGFPDDWTKLDSQGHVVSDVRRAFFMGNALVIGVIARIGKALGSELKKSN